MPQIQWSRRREKYVTRFSCRNTRSRARSRWTFYLWFSLLLKKPGFSVPSVTDLYKTGPPLTVVSQRPHEEDWTGPRRLLPLGRRGRERRYFYLEILLAVLVPVTFQVGDVTLKVSSFHLGVLFFRKGVYMVLLKCVVLLECITFPKKFSLLLPLTVNILLVILGKYDQSLFPFWSWLQRSGDQDMRKRIDTVDKKSRSRSPLCLFTKEDFSFLFFFSFSYFYLMNSRKTRCYCPTSTFQSPSVKVWL